MKKGKVYVFGVLIGLINALFGAGGGMVCVPLLKSMGANQKQAQATTLAVILPLSAVTAVIYLLKDYMTISDAAPFVIPGFLGAVFGSFFMQKISNSALRKIFAAFMLWAGIRMIMK